MQKKKMKLGDYLLKIKNPSRPQLRLPSKKWIFSSCKHPRTPSFALYGGRNQEEQTHHHHHHHHVRPQLKDDDDAAATLADVDRFLLENFKSLYLKDNQEETTKTMPRGSTGSLLLEDALTTLNTTTSTDEAGSVSSTINDNVSSSNSYSSSYNNDNEKEGVVLPDNSIALLTHSTSPYNDFKSSMQQMVNNHENVVDWDFMEDLLFSYLNLNHKKSHKFILSAFVDLITLMRSTTNSKPPNSSHKNPRSVRTVRSTSRELIKENHTYDQILRDLQFGSS